MKRPGRGRWLAWPALLYLIVFLIGPLGVVASYSFRERNVRGGVLPLHGGQ